MNPFFFGRSERPLFGAYTQGRSTADASGSVLLCYPVGSEYMRAHRAFRQLNTLLNRAGLNVLRFDYSCTGDSGGSGEEATIEAWIDDIDWAVDELMDNALADSISVLGLRWGATLAALATKDRDDVDHVVLWDPIVSGEAYLSSVMDDPRASGIVGVEGFPYSEELRKEMASVDLRERPEVLDGTEVSILVAEDKQAYRELETALQDHGGRPRYELVPSPSDWSRADPFGDALIPQEIIQVAVRLLTAED